MIKGCREPFDEGIKICRPVKLVVVAGEEVRDPFALAVAMIRATTFPCVCEPPARPPLSRVKLDEETGNTRMPCKDRSGTEAEEVVAEELAFMEAEVVFELLPAVDEFKAFELWG